MSRDFELDLNRKYVIFPTELGEVDLIPADGFFEVGNIVVPAATPSSRKLPINKGGILDAIEERLEEICSDAGFPENLDGHEKAMDGLLSIMQDIEEGKLEV